MLVMMSKKQTNQGQSLAPLIKHCHLSTANPTDTEGHTHTHTLHPPHITNPHNVCTNLCMHVYTCMNAPQDMHKRTYYTEGNTQAKKQNVMGCDYGKLYSPCILGWIKTFQYFPEIHHWFICFLSKQNIQYLILMTFNDIKSVQI